MGFVKRLKTPERGNFIMNKFKAGCILIVWLLVLIVWSAFLAGFLKYPQLRTAGGWFALISIALLNPYFGYEVFHSLDN